MQKRFFWTFLFIIINQYAVQVNFHDSSFDNFLEQMIPSEQQSEFRRYYRELINKCEKYLEKKNQTKWRTLYQEKRQKMAIRGRTRLEVTDPFCAENIRKNYVKADKLLQENMDEFLRRCGAYDEFLEMKGKQAHTVWARTKTYVRNAGNSVASWLNSWRKPKEVMA